LRCASADAATPRRHLRRRHYFRPLRLIFRIFFSAGLNSFISFTPTAD
jgi:hypothetical protein